MACPLSLCHQWYRLRAHPFPELLVQARGPVLSEQFFGA